jgi:rhodanese-related sulfurtransferase
MRLIIKALIALALSVAGLVSLTACASTPIVKIEVTDNTRIIDVRSADKFNSGHVEGAYNIDFSSASVDGTLQGLSRSDTYIIYGDDESQLEKAWNKMTGAGFIDVKHSGSMDYVSQATGLPIVSN